MNEVLKNSVSYMLSEDYKERFIGEYMQLKNRYENLNKMLNNWDKGTLNFTPTCPREIYTIQIDIFSLYDYVELAKTIKNILKAKGYVYIQGDGDLYEPDTKLYHKAMRFKYSMFI